MTTTPRMKIVEKENLFESTDKQIKRIEEPAILVLTEPSLTTAGGMPSGKQSRGYYLFDGGLLSTHDMDDTYNIKNVVFPNHEWVKAIIDKYGFSDPKKRLWFFIPSNMRQDKSGAFWIRTNPLANPQFVQYLETVRSDSAMMKKLIKKVLLGIKKRRKQTQDLEESEESEESEDTEESDDN